MASTKFDLSAFEENINTEFQAPYGKILPIKAIKTDAKGKASLKNMLGAGKIKTCDYVSIRSNSLLMIEFSDLKSQEEGVEKLISVLKNKQCPVDKHNKRMCVKKEVNKIEDKFKAKDLVFSELRQKCIETTLLTHKIADKEKFVYTQKFQNKKFIVVIKELKPADTPAMELLKNKLSGALKDIVDTVKIIPQEHLENIFKKAVNS